MPPQAILPAVAAHGATRLPSVDLDSYNVELKDDEGFLGDRASKGAFRKLIENWRSALRRLGADPLGEDSSEELTKKRLDDLLARGDPEAAGIIQVQRPGSLRQCRATLQAGAGVNARAEGECPLSTSL
jgi:hypothetical protein